MEEIDIDELNEKIKNPTKNLNSLKGFEIIAESLVYRIYDLFGRNMLLNALFQTGARAGEIVAKELKEKHGKKLFKIEEAVPLLLESLKEFYSIKIKKIEKISNKIRILIENHCFLRETIKNRESLKFGSAFCRINKGYFESAFQDLVNIKSVEINFIESDDEKDVCIEELIFYL